MTIPLLEPRVTSLESMVASLVEVSLRTQDNVDQLADEMRTFKIEMKDFKDQTAKERREFNKQLGQIANKQGRMTEDLVAPSVGRILREVVGAPCDSQDQEAIRVKRRHQITRERREFDAVAECRESIY